MIGPDVLCFPRQFLPIGVNVDYRTSSMKQSPTRILASVLFFVLNEFRQTVLAEAAPSFTMQDAPKGWTLTHDEPRVVLRPGQTLRLPVTVRFAPLSRLKKPRWYRPRARWKALAPRMIVLSTSKNAATCGPAAGAVSPGVGSGTRSL